MQAPLQLNQVGAPLEWVAMDIFRPLPCTHQGNTYILMVMDYFTKWLEAYALHNQEAGLWHRPSWKVFHAGTGFWKSCTPIRVEILKANY